MSDPGYALQSAIVGVLRTDVDLIELIGARIYDTVPAAATYPYVTLGEDIVVNDSADCVDGAATTVTIHAWSKPPAKEGSGEVKRIAALIARILDQSEPDLGDEHAVVSFDHNSTTYLRDPDGLTRHAVLTFNVLTDAVG